MSDDHAVKTDSMLTGLEQPQGGLTRSEREMTGPRTALSVAANLSGGYASYQALRSAGVIRTV